MIFDSICNVMKWGIMIFAGFSAGTLVSSGIFAYITMIGIIPRLAAKTRTADDICWYESAVIWGGTLGSIIYIFDLGLNVGGIVGMILGTLFGLGAGIFVGCLAVALAEVLRSFPIFSMRIKLKGGVWYIAFALALGKALGSMYGLMSK